MAKPRYMAGRLAVGEQLRADGRLEGLQRLGVRHEMCSMEREKQHVGGSERVLRRRYRHRRDARFRPEWPESAGILTGTGRGFLCPGLDDGTRSSGRNGRYRNGIYNALCLNPELFRLLPRGRGPRLASSPNPTLRSRSTSLIGMASDTEGIAALFSMYNDDGDDDEEEDADVPSAPSPASPAAAAPDPAVASSPPLPQAVGEGPNASLAPPSPPLPEESAGRKTLASPHPPSALPPLPSRRSSSPFAVSSPSPLLPPPSAPPADLPRPPRRGSLAIVDYAHDEMAMSPEQEDGEIMSGAGRFGSDVQAAEGNLEVQTLSGTVHIMTPNTEAEVSQQPNAPEPNQAGTDTAMDVTRAEIEDAQVEECPDISTNGGNDDPLSRFLPPPVTKNCSAALQQKINKFLAYKRAGKSFNAEVRNRKDYRNPDFLQHAVRYQEIDQIGTCFSKDVFDPYGYDKSDYYEEIEADMKRELERKEQEKKRSPKVEFIAGGVQPPISASLPKIPALAGVTTLPVPVEGVQKETRPNKKSKWDKVDGDTKNPAVPSGHDNLSATVSAALLTSANVGSRYPAFAQQKRKEAEERRTSDYKSDRRS